MYLADEHKIWVCKGEDNICMLPKMANRHGLIAGATGTGKTVTLKVLAESFSERWACRYSWPISKATFPVCARLVKAVKGFRNVCIN